MVCKPWILLAVLLILFHGPWMVWGEVEGWMDRYRQTGLVDGWTDRTGGWTDG